VGGKGSGGNHGGDVGRPLGLSFQRRLAIGAFCEERHSVITRRRALRSIAADRKRQQRRKLQAKMRRLRRQFSGRLPAAALFSIEKMSRAMDGIGRAYSAPLKRPKSARETILRQAAIKFKIPMGTADKCWKLARKLIAEHRKTPHSAEAALLNAHID
jgi:hypothetical protein